MKLSFSTRNVSAESFLALCNKTAQYRFSGIEVYDAALEKMKSRGYGLPGRSMTTVSSILPPLQAPEESW